ncbi:hypothetical protein C0J52_27797 [Blattella germanica]|nr:hypothetical protein C0J52_27797 [Blattella germanica]
MGTALLPINARAMKGIRRKRTKTPMSVFHIVQRPAGTENVWHQTSANVMKVITRIDRQDTASPRAQDARMETAWHPIRATATEATHAKTRIAPRSAKTGV